MRAKASVRLNAYAIISDAVDRGAARAWHTRIFKHTDKPTDDQAIEAIARAVTDELAEILEFDHA